MLVPLERKAVRNDQALVAVEGKNSEQETKIQSFYSDPKYYGSSNPSSKICRDVNSVSAMQ